MSINGHGCVARVRSGGDRERPLRRPRPYCQCKLGSPVPWKAMSSCHCGENCDVKEWKWANPVNTSWVVVSEDQETVTFHPFYSSGTATVRGDTAMMHNYHYYWEVKMLTETYGTDIMVGLSSDKAEFDSLHFEFKSLLGQDAESYGLSYKGEVRHEANVSKESAGFCRGTIVGVRLDMWSGTMEFYINRRPQGISFYNLRRHNALYPTLCSTAAQSSMKLTFANCWKASLQLEALKILNASINASAKLFVPPGLRRVIKNQVWMSQLEDSADEERPKKTNDNPAKAADVRTRKKRKVKKGKKKRNRRRRPWRPAKAVAVAGAGAEAEAKAETEEEEEEDEDQVKLGWRGWRGFRHPAPGPQENESGIERSLLWLDNNRGPLDPATIPAGMPRPERSEFDAYLRHLIMQDIRIAGIRATVDDVMG